VDLKITGMHAGIKGSVSIFLSGDVSGLSGDVSGLSGDVNGLSGNVTGLRGDVSGLSGDVNDCEITDSERKNGVKIEDLIDEKQS
jgi:aggrecan 1